MLAEPFHLSYPYVFAWRGEYYMVPECHAAGAVRLYRAAEFPTRWVQVADLLTGPIMRIFPLPALQKGGGCSARPVRRWPMTR